MTIKKTYTTSPAQDTLTQAAEKAGLSKETVDSVRKWLAGQLLANVNAKLSQGGHKEENVALRQVFVDLPLEPDLRSGDGERHYFLKEFLAAKPIPFTRQTQGELIPELFRD